MRKTIWAAAAATGLLALGFVGPAAADLPGIGTADSATGGGLEAAGLGTLGETEHGPVVEEVLDLPALEVGRDTEGRVVMDLPALKLVGPADAPAEPPVLPRPEEPAAPTEPRPEDPAPARARPVAPAADQLPVTGVNAGDVGAAGLALLGAGTVLVRRVRFSFA